MFYRLIIIIDFCFTMNVMRISEVIVRDVVIVIKLRVKSIEAK